jgi:hypothetical protein
MEGAASVDLAIPGNGRGRKSRWSARLLKALLGSLALLAILAGLTALLLYQAAGSAPQWYSAHGLSPASQPAREAEALLIEIQSWASARYAWEYARSTGRQPLAAEPEPSITITLTETQVNALLRKWFLIYSQQTISGVPLKDTFAGPMVHFSADRITLAAALPEMNSRIFSIEIRPEVLPDQRLDLQLLGAYAGTLPLPEFAWAKSRTNLLADLSRQYAELRRQAGIDGGGGANSQCVETIWSAQAIAVLTHAPTFGVIFLPVLSDGVALPVRIESVDLQDGLLRLCVQVIPPEQRRELLSHLPG